MADIYDVATGNFTPGNGPIIEDIVDDTKDKDLIQEPTTTKENAFLYDVETPIDPVPPVVEEEEEEEEEVEIEKDVEVDKEDPYKDYSEAAIYAETMKELGFFKEDYEVQKDIDHKSLIQNMIAKAQDLALNNAKAELAKKYDEDTLRAASYIKQGGDPEMLKQEVVFEKLSTITPESDTEKDQVILAYHTQQGIDPETSKLVLESLKDRGLVDKEIEKAQGHFKTLAEDLKEKTKVAAPTKEEVEAHAQQQHFDQVSTIIKKGKLGPFELNEKEQTKLTEYTTKRQYLIPITHPDGTVENTFVTGFQRDYSKLMNQPEKQLILAKLMSENFDLSFVKNEIQTDTITSALDRLNRKKPQAKKRYTNPYYRD